MRRAPALCLASLLVAAAPVARAQATKPTLFVEVAGAFVPVAFLLPAM